MPELPEVETIRRGLEKHLVGKRISSIEVIFAKLFSGDPAQVVDQEIIGVRRFGKGLVIDFANEQSIVAHVKMTGQFIYMDKSEKINLHPKLSIGADLPHKHTHVVFHLSAIGHKPLATLYYNDIRKFGWIKIVPTKEVAGLSFFKSLGKELPIKGLLGTMTLQESEAILGSSSLPVKALIMDQQKIAGVGNIYANDGLFLARIDPRRKANSLKKEEAGRLYKSLIEVLEKGLLHGGASDVNYIQVDGGKGEYQDHFLVYGRSGEECLVCKSTIERIVVGGRGTFLCPTCQK